jgi:hypothetical protein
MIEDSGGGRNEGFDEASGGNSAGDAGRSGAVVGRGWNEEFRHGE